jgi:hypothetical protein
MAVKHETITVSGTVIYCDGCGKRGPESAYDNVSDCIDQMEIMGWTQDNKRDRDLCDECSKPKTKTERRKS